ncbi:hydrogenase iron-sulfur subunit [Candidatus Magnetobacterium casense]|uniref:Hydrogenase iron-sulfur subunit n=1 Tax=Candidatus Magnetobacterium casense TaxID=1455061 RepID=A0ABS6S1S6_9BACT|nr:hydrogenase iron-sulfur subunit [Candidatus Magnetobacterium casensis]MBV6342378.1 hydrogenase iron-sulfur subunit [Candidatus Magnetobacterium casensis]
MENETKLAETTTLQKAFHKLSTVFSRIFSSNLNPLYHLGAIAIYLFLVDTFSGIYLYIFYKIDPRYVYTSVEAISNSFIGNIMRGLHRYTSAGLIFVTLLHTIHVLVTDRFRMFRWIAWITGVLALGTFLVIGISGYILVWDVKAQLIGILTGKFLSYLPVFGHSIMSTFLGSDIKLLGGMFRMVMYFHVALTLGIVFILWLHVLRNARPRIVPPKFLWVALSVILVVVSIVFKAKSDEGANLSNISFVISMDWAYFFVYPLMKIMPLSWMWLTVSVVTLILISFPWLIKGKKIHPVVIDHEKCTGCECCYIDCPYEAVIMQRLDTGKKKSVVNENKCAGCGICIGSCSFKAITLPAFPWQRVLDDIREKAPDVVVFRCRFSAEVPDRDKQFTCTVPCIGSVHTRFPKEILGGGVKGVCLVGCETDDCHYREGSKWTMARYEGSRKPSLDKQTDPSRIRILQATSTSGIAQELDSFTRDLNDGKKFDTVTVRGNRKLNYAVASLLLLIPTLLLYPLTSDRMAFYPEDKSVVILTFKYRSTSSVASARSPIKVTMQVNQKEVFSHIYNPRGIRQDSSIFVYDEILLNPEHAEISLKMEETLFPEKHEELNLTKDLKPKDSIIITYDDATKNLIFLK